MHTEHLLYSDKYHYHDITYTVLEDLGHIAQP